jgi:hypothetical protein
VSRIDTSKLDGATRARLERALKPRNKTLSLVFRASSVAAWRKAARKEPARDGAHGHAVRECLTDWMERHLNASADRVLRRALTEAFVARDHERKTQLSRNFYAGDIERWKRAASRGGESLTSFIERVLDVAAIKKGPPPIT